MVPNLVLWPVLYKYIVSTPHDFVVIYNDFAAMYRDITVNYMVLCACTS